MYNTDTLDVKLIDMDGSRLFDAKELDLGKLSQSILSNYNQWKNLEGSKLVQNFDLQSRKFQALDSYFNSSEIVIPPTELINLWHPILEQPHVTVLKKAYFYMSTYFIRFVPFRMQLGKEHGIFALLMAAAWLNKLLLIRRIE